MRLRRRCLLLILLLLIIFWFTSCSDSSQKESGTATETATLRKMLDVALQPVGKTMYVWGGGWSPDDGKAGDSATQIGVSPLWEEFTKQQNEQYDFEEHMDEQEKGLDCSGYVGWVMYNLFESKDGQDGYVSLSTGMAETLSQRGWGQLIWNPREFLPGDIVSMQGHVWISLGTCADGSVLLVHSSPPGVSVCGTEIPGKKSIAIQLAEKFMTENYPKWQEKYPNRAVPTTYLEEVTVLRWSEDTLKDANDYQSLSGEEIIDLL